MAAASTNAFGFVDLSIAPALRLHHLSTSLPGIGQAGVERGVGAQRGSSNQASPPPLCGTCRTNIDRAERPEDQTTCNGAAVQRMPHLKAADEHVFDEINVHFCVRATSSPSQLAESGRPPHPYSTTLHQQKYNNQGG